LALGIVVDDAIVIGENIYAHREQGKNLVEAAIDGAYEVLPSVTASVTTTVIAFMPLFYVSGVMGKFIAVLPLAVITMLIISLVESTFILPCHLAHDDNLLIRMMTVVFYPIRLLGSLIHAIHLRVSSLLAKGIEDAYTPALAWSIRNPVIVCSIAASLFVITIGCVRGGVTPWVVFPELDSNWIESKAVFPDGTPTVATLAATKQIEDAFEQVNAKYYDEQGIPLKRLIHRAVGEVSSPGALGPDSRTSGGHVGNVFIELTDTSQRTITSEEILDEWRSKTGDIPGVDTLTFGTPEMGPGGVPIEFKLLASPEHMEELEAAVEACKAELSNTWKYPGVVDIQDDSRPGKLEYQLAVKGNARTMGITAADLAETVRASYFGEEVMRLQRGRHEVKLMVRYPEEDRRSLASFDEIRVRGTDGAERPLTELASVRVARGYSEINRVDQLRSITITANIRKDEGNSQNTVQKLKAEFMPTNFGTDQPDLSLPERLVAFWKGAEEENVRIDTPRFPNVLVRWEGQAEQSAESMRSLFLGFIVAMLSMFLLLTVEFRSYFQPLIVLLIIPFGLIGAVWGHAMLGLPITMFSVFGLVALAGVVVNDSIVLMDFINRRLSQGDDFYSAVISAGQRRFRPVVLTSLTTVAGLTPILLEKSFQAQVLIPMAASLCFGLMLATLLVLFLVPVFFTIYGRLALRAKLPPMASPQQKLDPENPPVVESEPSEEVLANR